LWSVNIFFFVEKNLLLESSVWRYELTT
jgi:hypothetical protein